MTQWTVLGGRGFVGSRLATHLRLQGGDVWAPDREDFPKLWTRPLGHVFYCIGTTGDFRHRPFDTMDAHVGLLGQVLQRATFQTLTYLSSTRVYLGSRRTDEDAPLTVQPGQPSDLYNLSKLAGEALCHACQRSGVRIARLSNVIGPGMETSSGNFVAQLIAEAQSGHIVLNSDPGSTKDYIDLRDVVGLLRLISEQGSKQVYNVASGVQTTHCDLINRISKASGCTWSIKPGSPIQSHNKIDIRRVIEEFSFRPRFINVEELMVSNSDCRATHP